MFDRDDLARQVLLGLTPYGTPPHKAVDYAFQVADLMISEKNRAKIGFVRFRIGPVTKQPKVVPAVCGHSSHPVPSKGVSTMASVLKSDEQVSVVLEFFDKKGVKIENPKLDGVPKWETTDSAKVSVTPAADGLSALVVATGTANDEATITNTADADLGEGVRNIVTTGDVKVIGGDIATSNMKFGDPVKQP